MKNRIIEIVQKITSASEINEDSSLIDLGIDSLKTMDLLLLIEEEFGLDIDEKYLIPEYFKSIKSLVKLVHDVQSSRK